jgi:hypothetical protein
LKTQHISKSIEKNNAKSNGLSHKPSKNFKSLIDSTLHMFFGSIAINLYMFFWNYYQKLTQVLKEMISHYTHFLELLLELTQVFEKK